VRVRGYRISTGFVGTPLICDALCSVGHEDAAFRLLNQRECPSWLYPVTMGATTIWERWDSLRPDGSVNPGEMTSFNHYAMGAVADWLHRTIGGLAPAAPGYRQLEIQPRPGGGLTHASARHRTPYGMAQCSWSITEGKMTLEVLIPPNTSANVTLPGASTGSVKVGPGKHTWSYPYSDTRANRSPLSLDSTVGELIDNLEAFTRVMEILREYGTEFADNLMSQENMSLRQAVAFMPQSEALMATLESVLVTFGYQHENTS
jgi:alpha-L-rhamnosidase